jgi:hypothetical protein
MHANPVKPKLVEHAKDLPWSSWSHYARRETGLLRIDNLARQEMRTQLQAKSSKSQKLHPLKPKGAAPKIG